MSAGELPSALMQVNSGFNRWWKQRPPINTLPNARYSHPLTDYTKYKVILVGGDRHTGNRILYSFPMTVLEDKGDGFPVPDWFPELSAEGGPCNHIIAYMVDNGLSEEAALWLFEGTLTPLCDPEN